MDVFKNIPTAEVDRSSGIPTHNHLSQVGACIKEN